jgi:hypothetical protein
MGEVVSGEWKFEAVSSLVQPRGGACEVGGTLRLTSGAILPSKSEILQLFIEKAAN